MHDNNSIKKVFHSAANGRKFWLDNTMSEYYVYTDWVDLGKSVLSKSMNKIQNIYM